MDIGQGEVFKNTTDGVDFVVKKIVGHMVILESQDGKRQVYDRSTYLNIILSEKGRRRIAKQDLRLPFPPPYFQVSLGIT